MYHTTILGHFLLHLLSQQHIRTLTRPNGIYTYISIYIYRQFRVRRNQPSKNFLKKWNFVGIQTCRA